MKKLRKVALLIDTARETGREILQGIIRYNRENGPWLTYFQPQGVEEEPPKWLAGWKGDGILARINSQRAAIMIQKTGLPVIDVRAATVLPTIPRMEVDNDLLAEMVVSYLLDRGIRSFAFCAYPPRLHRLYDERCRSFVRCVENLGFRCQVFHPDASTARPLSWDAELKQIEKWINTLRSGVGIMACNDDLGRIVLDVCLQAGRRVPDEIAVVGVENDPFLCNLCSPPLTSVDVNGERLGYDACVLLEKRMQGKPVPDCVRSPPLRIVERQSTDTLAIDDPHLASAIRYIRTNACRGISVDDLSQQIPISRSSLNRKFQETLGRGPKEEIARVRMDRARELLSTSERSIRDVALACGFSDSNYFSRWFHDQQGISPRRFRMMFAK